MRTAERFPNLGHTRVLALLAMLANLPTIATAGATFPGFLDFDFSGDGRVTIPFDLGGVIVDRLEATAVHTDGTIVVVGWATTASDIEAVVARLLPDGSLDPSFGSGGKVVETIDLGGTNNDFFEAVAIQADGKIVVAGTVARGTDDSDIIVVRYNSDGTWDSSFGSGGSVLIDHNLGTPTIDEASAVAITSDGRILIAGNSETAAFANKFFTVTRLLHDGSFDTAFDVDGKVTYSTLGGRLYAFAVGPNGGPIYLVGRSVTGASDYACLVVRLLWNGSPDPAWFGTGAGVFNPNLGGSDDDRCYAVAIQPDGKPIFGLASTVDGVNNRDFVVMRTLPNADADSSFAGTGTLQLPFDLGTAGNTDDFLQTIALQSDGKIVVGGTVDAETNSRVFGIARLGLNGFLDTGFGLGGKIIVSFDHSGDDDQLAALAIANDGRIVAAGTTDRSPGNLDTDFAVARLTNNLIFADGFEWEATSRWSATVP